MQRKTRIAFYLILTVPFFVFGRIIIFLRYGPFVDDFKKCQQALFNSINSEDAANLSRISEILVVAEDHRNGYHFGIDFIGIFRAFKVKIVTGRQQGASTIDQQFVRAITGRRERNIRRKIREQLLASLIRLVFSREDINLAYLRNAYYGESYIGEKGVVELLGRGVSECEIVAYIKFPLPSRSSEAHDLKIARRVGHIEKIRLGEIKLIWMQKFIF